VKHDQELDSANKSDSLSNLSESESESSDDIITLDECPSGWIKKPLDKNI
jgi:hypothetical protein